MICFFFFFKPRFLYHPCFRSARNYRGFGRDGNQGPRPAAESQRENVGGLRCAHDRSFVHCRRRHPGQIFSFLCDCCADLAMALYKSSTYPPVIPLNFPYSPTHQLTHPPSAPTRSHPFLLCSHTFPLCSHPLPLCFHLSPLSFHHPLTPLTHLTHSPHSLTHPPADLGGYLSGSAS